jgi:hypothetical protein
VPVCAQPAGRPLHRGVSRSAQGPRQPGRHVVCDTPIATACGFELACTRLALPGNTVADVTGRANFSGERMAAGGADLEIPTLAVRRHRSPRRWL